MIYFLVKLSWPNEIAQVLVDRVPGESFINPYDISKLRDFNLFMLLTSIMSLVLNALAGYTGNSNSSISAHESKMASVIATWRGAFTFIFFIIFALAIITIMNHVNFAKEAKDIRVSISENIAEELIPNITEREKFMNVIKAIPASTHVVGKGTPMSQEQNADTVYFETAQKYFGTDGSGSSKTQQYKTLFGQLMLPAV
ncbi:MAG: hypothetical protein IJ950_04630, partial [Helicobacter sp.]|nr:hypothetical protein [Helicobacter sp.]